MDAETKKPKRVTRSQKSVDGESTKNAVAAPKKTKSRSKRSKTISESDGGSEEHHQNVDDDFDDAASTSSKSSTSSSVRSCKVILQRENFDDILKASADDGRATAHSTRARKSSQLTEENVAAHLNPARRALRSSSVASDGTGSTKSRTTRSARLTASQSHTPAKEVSSPRPATPTRRSSRLLSENEKAIDSPAKPAPGKRNLRSTSVASVDESSPQPLTRTRSSSRLSETQGTPVKASKTTVSKIKTEPITPGRRASSRINKSSMLSDIIDEESSDDDKPKKDNKKTMKTVEEEEKTMESNKIEPTISIKVEFDGPKDGQPQDTGAIEKSPIVSSTVDDELVELVTTEPVSNVTPEVLITVMATETPESTETLIEQQADTPSVEPAEPMETSMAEHIEQGETPNETESTVADISNEHGSGTPKTNSASNGLDSMDVTENVLSPPHSNESNRQTEQQQQQQSPAIIEEVVQVKIEKPIDTDTDQVSKSANIDDTLTELLKSYSPKKKSRPSEAFKAMDVSALIHDEDVSSPAPPAASASPSKQLKVATKRLSLNSSVQSTGFDKMEVSALAADLGAVEEEPDNLSGAQKEVNTKELLNENVESPKRKTRLSVPLMSTENTPVALVSESPSKVKTPKASTSKSSNASPKKTPITVLPISLTPFITPVPKDFDYSFNKIAYDLTPSLNQSSINRQIDDIVANMTVDTSILEPATTAASGDDQVPENNIVTEDNPNENSIRNDQHDVSVVDKTQPDLDETSMQTEVIEPKEPTSIVKTVRKSVQIMTPKNEKRADSAEKRVDTPYPTAATIVESANSPSELDDGKKTSDEVHSKDTEELQKFGESWSKPIRQVSLTYDSPKPIDAHGVDTNDKTEDKTEKKAVPARNNWSVGLIDSESEEESIVPDSGAEEEEDIDDEEGAEEEEEEEEVGSSSFINDGAEEAEEDYESGDSMDEHERREVKENEVVEAGEDLGSEDSEEEMDDDDYDSQDSFLVNDEEDVQIQSTDDDDEEEAVQRIIKQVSNGRRSRIIIESSTDDSNMEGSIDVSSDDVVSVSVQADSVVVLVGNNAVEEKIVEGKTFATTYLIPENDAQQNETRTEKIVEKESVEIDTIEQPHTEENDQVVNESAKDDETTTSTSPIMDSNEVENDLTEKPGSTVTTETVPVPQNITQSTSTNEANEDVSKSPKPNSGANDVKDKVSAKQMDLMKKSRASMPGIDPLSKASSNLGKKANRMSLGDLNPNQQHLRGEIFDKKPLTKSKAISSKMNLIEKDGNDSTIAQQSITEPQQIETDERESNMDASTSSTENVSPNHSKSAPLNISSQEEENNNRKSSAKKSDETIQSGEVISTVSETDHETATKTNASAKKKKARSKRKFDEVDVSDEDQVRAEPKKLLKIINTASGLFLEEPMTPEKKNKFAFQVTPLTPVNKDFRVKKRKSIYIEKDDPMVDEFLPKPKWKINTQFETEDQPRKRARKLDVGSTEMIIKPLESKKKTKPTIPEDVRKFRHRQMFRSDVPREDKRAQLRQLYKKRANFQ